jgi:flagellar basal-body rod protein FlgB
VSEVYLFQIASRRSQWLDARQSLIADNVANANTPAYQARDLKPFSAVLDSAEITMTTTDPLHIAATQVDLNPASAEDSDATNATLSGNSVNLEQEMINLGEVSRDSTMTNNIKRVFHQMMLSVLK